METYHQVWAGTKQLVYANELVELIKDHFGDSFEIFVAAYPEIHPESENYQKDIYWLNKKFEAGASRGITQYFYNSNSYLYFVEQCKKIWDRSAYNSGHYANY